MPRPKKQKYIPPRLSVAQYNALSQEEQAILLELLIKTFNLAAAKFGWTLEGDGVAVLGGPAPSTPRASSAPRAAAMNAQPAPTPAPAQPFSIPERAAVIAQRASRDQKPDLCMRYFTLFSTGTLNDITQYVQANTNQAKPVTRGAVKVVLWRLRNAGKVNLNDGVYSAR